MTSLSQQSINNSLTRANSSEIAGFSMINFAGGISISANTDYTVLTNGFVRLPWGVGNFQFKVNGNGQGQYIMGYNTSFAASIYIPIKKGDKINYHATCYFLPCYGG